MPLRLALLSLLLIACGAEPAKVTDEPVKPVQVVEAAPAPAPAPAPDAPKEEVSPMPAPVVASPIDASWKTHSDAKLRVELRYPADYLLKSTRQRDGSTSIVMLPDDEFARDWLAGRLKDQPTDGPMQIALHVRELQVAGTFEELIRSEMQQNGAVGEAEELSVAGMPALAYATDGLWQGRTVALAAYQDRFLLASGKRRMLVIDAHVDFNAPEDRIRKDFEAILGTLNRIDAK